MRIVAAAVVAAFLVASCAAPPPPATMMSWQLPMGWSAESNKFPFEFASTLPYRGTEEVRHAPGMYKPGTRDFWTYALVWALEGEPPVGETDLEANLTTYFKGLTESAGGSKFNLDPARYNTTLQPASDAAIAGHTAKRYIGRVALYDGFATGLPLDLNTEAFVWQCPAEKKTLVMFLFSPSARGSVVWENTRAVGESFRCHVGYGVR
jgi:hypothetical protein